MSLASVVQLAAAALTVVVVLLSWRLIRRQTAEIRLVHAAVNSNYSILSQRLEAALVVVQALKDEIVRLNRSGIITPREESTRGKVTLKDGVVDVPHPESG